MGAQAALDTPRGEPRTMCHETFILKQAPERSIVAVCRHGAIVHSFLVVLAAVVAPWSDHMV